VGSDAVAGDAAVYAVTMTVVTRRPAGPDGASNGAL